MFGKVNVQNSKVWESHTSEAQRLEKPKFRIPMFGKAKFQNSCQCLEKPKFRLAMIGKVKI